MGVRAGRHPLRVARLSPEAAAEPVVDKRKHVAEGFFDLLDGLGYHYPGEVNGGNVVEMLSALSGHGRIHPVLAAGSTDGVEPG